MKQLSLVLNHRPIPYARPGQGGKQRYTKASETQYRHFIMHMTKQAMLEQGYAPDVPIFGKHEAVSIHLMFYTDRIATGTPDLSNLVKLVEDAMKDIVWQDDCVITSINTRKIKDAKNPRTEVMINSDDDHDCSIWDCTEWSGHFDHWQDTHRRGGRPPLLR